MSQIAEALEEKLSAEEIRDAIVHEVNAPDPDGSSYKELVSNPEVTAEFEQITLWWIDLLAQTYRTKKFDENNKQISTKQYKAAMKVVKNPFMKVWLSRKNSFTDKAKAVVSLLAEEDGEFQTKWTRYAFFALQNIGGRLKNR